MKLTRLRLLGFKSFVEPTDFLIEPGLTGVVGPNGCGKSNLVEALRWVMGETSHKSMRAADMNDVIFNGNNSRPPRNTAEVAILIDNSDHGAPAQFNGDEKLDVSRRIERDEGSVYRVNGKEVRARDVQMLFADASTGSRSPALVHQGRIGEIIQAKPEQRRRVLEEAAGISGLHARRHEAELRLRAAEQNLTRLEDVIGQLTGQIDGLKRQSRQAVRYRTVAQQLRKAEATLFHLRFINATAEVADTSNVRDLAVREVAERTGMQAQFSTVQTNVAAGLPALRDAEAGAGAALHRLVVARETLDREEARAMERIAELDRRLVQISADAEREKKLATDAESALAKILAEQDVLEGEAAAGAERRDAVAERVAEADAALSGTERTFSELTAALAELSARRTQLERAEREHSERHTRLERELASVEKDIAQLESDTATAVDLDGAAAAVEMAQEAVADAEAATLRAEAAHSGARQALDVTRQPLAEAERRAHRLDTEAKTLARFLQVEAKNLWPPALEHLTVDKGFETAIGAALGDDLEAPIDANAPAHWAGAEASDDPALPAGVVSLADHVKGPPELARRLAQIGLVSRAEAPALVKQLRPGQRLVSPEGDLWRWDGFAVAANAPTGAARRLAGRNRLAEIEAELLTARSEVESRRAEVAAADAEVKATAQDETQARNARRDAQRMVDAARERHASAEREINRVTARQSALIEAQSRLTASLTEAESTRHDNAAAFAELPPTADLEAELNEVRNKLAGERGRVAEVRAEAQALTREVELAERRLNSMKTELVDWTNRRDNANTQIGILDARLSETTLDRRELDDAPNMFAERRIGLIDEVSQAQTARKAAADELATGENLLAEADRAARASLEAMSAAREELARAEERHEGAQRRLTDVSHEIREMLEVEPEAVAALAEIEPGAQLASVSAVEAELEKLRRERERLGAVNLRAEEELREVEEQHTKLTTERDDLVEAIKRLRQGIQSLNKEARERLLASFEVVNSHFKRLFSELFGGGNAELQLTESDDPLEAGLDILAKPPGKKPATLSLLSGGEQALTAMALIFAVFLTNPAPICVLDEVDAPLDDHNVDRFCNLLDEMTRSTDTRFVIITHNPITMARMNRLFGVTMAERGVSQLVSVDLDGAVKIRDSA